ncbi:MAG: isoprenylcysteine carboxylmethyltransferase family protein [Chroococcidiopsidaceae cyanobacterium CP_BM_ER_R8_30]|nr:isoprenylcysteine carboxylmethyltransferase family protein [Chroococcidiopsidaceae cyanobacterium CP_BM_ER_R8_30]
MNSLTLKILFMVGLGLSLVIRFPYRQEQRQNTIVDDRKTSQEKLILVLIFIGMLLLPLIYVFSSWLNVANYRQPIWINGLGVTTFTIALWLFWRSHHDLGKNWSPTLQIRDGHTLITNGVYHHVRHPMYTSILLWCIAQALLLPNWVAGWAGIISFGIAYITRIGKEEQMLLDRFGDEYEAYKERTKRLVPYLF